MTFRRRLIPVAALVVAIGASAAGAATAAETGGSGAGGSDKAQKAASCKVELKDGIAKKAAEAKIPGKIPAKVAGKVAGRGQIVVKDGSGQSAAVCKKKVAVIGLDTVAAKLGVSKPALALALKQTEQWAVGSSTKPSVARFEQHLAGLLHVPASKVASVLGSFEHTQ
jgi:hypothetical protein